MAKSLKKMTVLVIEDEADIRRFISRVLELEGYRVLQAGDGDEGLILAKEKGIALVLLDLMMPGRDGWAVLKEMKAAPELSAIPVIVLSGMVGGIERDKVLSMGAVDYLVKPLGVAGLREVVARTLRR